MSDTCPISHNWRKEEFVLEIHSGISFIKRLEPSQGTKGGGRRGKVSNFTKASRKRLLQKMATYRHMDDGYFATFTYPGHFTWTPENCKSHMAALRKRILYFLPGARVIWRMEIKQRLSGESIGEPVPHFHLLIFGLPYGMESELTKLLGDMWNEIANNQTQDFAYLISEVKQIRSRKHAVYYASKYAAKIDDGLDEQFGRHWGVFGQWDDSMSLSASMTMREMIQLKRLVRSWLKSRGKRSIARLFAGIRQDFGIAIFGLGDNDDLTGATCLAIDMLMAVHSEAARLT
jgi:hypothetical protein